MEDYQDKRTSEAKAQRRSVRRSKREYCEYLKKIGRWDEYYSCARKRRYRTRSEALDSARWRSGQTNSPLYCYECRYCGGWHVSHKDGRDGRYQSMFKERKYRGGVDPNSRNVQRSAAFGVVDSVLDSLTCEVCSVGEIDMSHGETLYGLYSTVDAAWVRWAAEGDLELL